MNETTSFYVAGRMIGGTNCGPGYIIYVGSDGKLHIKRVPGWDPLLQAQFDAAVSVLQQASQIKEEKIEGKLVAAAQSILEPIGQQIFKAVR